MEPEPKDKNGKYALGALLAIGVAALAIFGHSAIAQEQQGNQEKQTYQGYGNQDRNSGGNKDGGGVYSVPDAGSTAALLGLSVAFVGLAQRKFAIGK